MPPNIKIGKRISEKYIPGVLSPIDRGTDPNNVEINISQTQIYFCILIFGDLKTTGNNKIVNGNSAIIVTSMLNTFMSFTLSSTKPTPKANCVINYSEQKEINDLSLSSSISSN